MTRIAVTLATALAALLIVAPAAHAGPRLSAIEREVIQRLNDQRAQRGLQPLRAARGLNRAADRHSKDMLARDFFDHPSSDGTPFDLAFLDPPYGKGLGERALAGLLAGGWLASGALAVLERGADEPPADIPGFELLAEREWGPARVLFLQVL